MRGDMQRFKRNLREFGGSYLASMTASATVGLATGVVGSVFTDSILAAIGEYSYDWYIGHPFFLAGGVVISLMQGIVLGKRSTMKVYLISCAMCLSLIIVYTFTQVPMDAPVLTGVHTREQFALFLLWGFQLFAILVMGAFKVMALVLEKIVTISSVPDRQEEAVSR